MSDSTFYAKYATIFDQVKINNIQVQIRPYTYGDTPAYVLTAAFDRNGISDPAATMTESKITSYSSARNIMVTNTGMNTLYINNKPITMQERQQYVATASIPNIALSLTDDVGNTTSTSSTAWWPYKPILLVANK